jgi:POLQ-like helicase
MNFIGGQQMKPKGKSINLLSVTRAKAKMIEYKVPEEHQGLNFTINPSKLFTISIGILGDYAGWFNRQNISSIDLAELRKSLIFSSTFFDSYFQSRMNDKLDPYLILLASASYYLGDLPGSSKVLADRITNSYLNLEGEGLELLLLLLLQNKTNIRISSDSKKYEQLINEVLGRFNYFIKTGLNEKDLLEVSILLRRLTYDIGTPRQLLLGDLVTAIIKKKYENSAWYALPLYSGLDIATWRPVIKKQLFIKEFWPAQHLIGKEGILNGKSAVVQMPTSAGKSKATELIIRSAFLANRTSLALVVAPFNALCHEIKNSMLLAFKNESIYVDELSDVLQIDFNLLEFFNKKQVLIVTPEKLLYVLRHNPELASKVGLVIFDEGHQFDSGIRGISYELLLTSLRSMLPDESQKVLISAVISNANAVGEWLNGSESKIIKGTNLTPTAKSIGFASWLDQLGQIKFISNENSDKEEFFVPRVIESYNLQKKSGEIKDRRFPEKSKGQEIALYLGLKMVQNGSVAIFCGTKDTVSNLCEKAVDIFDRGLPLQSPASYSDELETKRLTSLYIQHFGIDSKASKSSSLGIFSHHRNIPHGIRLAIEHAMRESLIHFVICTSTLAQGVNLPIRYLIVTSINQGSEEIKVRDFHNLIGRAGRAGMHTEGSILFADPDVYDNKFNRFENWRWKRVKKLLDPGNSEDCTSSLFKLIPLVIRNDRSKAKDKKEHNLTWKVLPFASAYIKGWDHLNTLIRKIAIKYSEDGHTEDYIKSQIKFYVQMLAAIESFLLSNWDTDGAEITEEQIEKLAKETLAYNLADDVKKQEIVELFKLLASNIAENVKDSKFRVVYGKTLYGTRDIQRINTWLNENFESLLLTSTDDELLDAIWPILSTYIRNETFNKCSNAELLKNLSHLWILGVPFCDMFEFMQSNKIKLKWGKKSRNLEIEHVIEICEAGLAYDGILLVSALIELISLIEDEDIKILMYRFELLQKRLKYGLPTLESIILYELGFSDRVISQEVINTLDVQESAIDIIGEIKLNYKKVEKIIDKYPSYYMKILNNI